MVEIVHTTLTLTVLFPRIFKALLERRFLELRDRARRLEELLPRRVSSEEQREVLCLLCKVHELEIENAEMQSHALLKDNVIRQKNFVVQRFEQHRHLCDEIIQQQRQFIDGERQHYNKWLYVISVVGFEQQKRGKSISRSKEA